MRVRVRTEDEDQLGLRECGTDISEKIYRECVAIAVHIQRRSPKKQVALDGDPSHVESLLCTCDWRSSAVPWTAGWDEEHTV